MIKRVPTRLTEQRKFYMKALIPTLTDLMAIVAKYRFSMHVHVHVSPKSYQGLGDSQAILMSWETAD